MKRRKFIKTAAFGTIGAGIIPANLLSARDCDITGDDILGPYWSEDHPFRSILANSDEPGSRIFISGKVTANDCETPIQNALVDVWHANNDGCYTLFQECDSGNSDNDVNNLRGIMTTDENGNYAFESIWPGYYGGRPRHFHYKITTPSGLELVTQCYFEVDPYIDDDWEQNHSGLIIDLEETENGLIGVFNIVMNEDISQVNIKKEPFSISKEFKFNTVFPNPFNNAIQIDFRINHSGYVSIGIYDLRGHWVTNLVEEMKTEGAYSINWEGLDLNGNPVASGLYIVVMKFSDLLKTKKIKLVK
tara:strand:- start:78 stop:989 length:912 start_codon:yes stop_codon:yes gene_type:complete